MKTIKKILLTSILSLFALANLSLFSITSAQNAYDEILNKTTDSTSLKSAIDWGDVVKDSKWADLFNKQVDEIIGYVINFFIVIWIAVAFIWWYKIMTSDKEEATKEWINLIIFGILWIIIMISAKFLATSLVGDNGIITDEFATVENNHTPNWIEFASNLYNKIMYPFIKLILYFVVGILFFIMAGKVIWFVTATDDSTKKKAAWIIIRCVVWILIVMWSKQIVEAVIWNQNEVLNRNATRIRWWSETWWMWEEMLEFESVPIIAQIINWVMWLTMFIVLVLIIIQWYKILTKPDDPGTRTGMKKSIIYILIWILVIWAAYVISNSLVLNNIEIGATQ